MNENMLPVGTVLRSGTYRIEKQIGSGGFGNTYMVRHLGFDEVFAMKEFFMKDINLRDGSEVTVSIPDKKTTFESQCNKFRKEAQRLRSLNNLHIVKVHDLFEENGTAYYVMDLIDGRSFSDSVKNEGPLKEEKALDIFRQLLDALCVIHRQNPMMLHLDIKPSNIMIDKKGNAYLLDFGSSKQVDTDHNMTSSAFTLTPGYAPSELIDGNKDRIGPWTDLYELGATLYYLLTGKQPPTISEITEDGEEAFSFPPTISNNTRKLICWLMSLSRDKRPKSVEEVLNRLKGMGTSGGQGTNSPEPESKKPEEPKGPTMAPDDDETILKTSESRDDSTIYNPSGTDGGDKPKEAPQLQVPESKWITWGNSSLKDKIIGSVIGLAIVAGIIYWEESIKGKSQPAGNDTEVIDTEVIKSFDATEYASSQLDPVIQNLMNNMVYVSGGTFTMGATNEQGSDSRDRERPAHQVTLSSYSIGKYEVTQEEWEVVMGSNPSRFKGAKRPVELVSWNDCQEFIRKLNTITGKKFRFPTEAEWEFAARGGNNRHKYKYSGSSTIGSVAWYAGNSDRETHIVGQKQANELGLYDMSGNVWEWCHDWYGNYISGGQTNPTGPASGSYRVYRGGSMCEGAVGIRVSNRSFDSPDYRLIRLGFRLAL